MPQRWTPVDVREHIASLLGPLAIPTAFAIGAGVSACSSAVPPYATPPIPPREDCTDGLDNDGDGMTDCGDDECFGFEGCGNSVPPYAAPPMPPRENCTDGFDNDGDGMIDCADSECFETEVCTPPVPAYGIPMPADPGGSLEPSPIEPGGPEQPDAVLLYGVPSPQVQ